MVQRIRLKTEQRVLLPLEQPMEESRNQPIRDTMCTCSRTIIGGVRCLATSLLIHGYASTLFSLFNDLANYSIRKVKDSS